MISIITVNHNTYDFLALLIESLYLFSENPYEIIVIDNSNKQQQLNLAHVHQFFMPNNIGHGNGLNKGVTKAHELFPNNPFLMFLDSDCHIIKPRWDNYFLKKMTDYDLLAGKGVPSKPVRPACIFMRTQLGNYDWTASEGYKGNRLTTGGYDVGIQAYYKIMADRFRIGFIEGKKNSYGTLNGEEFCIDETPLVYHHWHGSHLEQRKDDFPDHDLITDKNLLFSKIPWRFPS